MTIVIDRLRRQSICFVLLWMALCGLFVRQCSRSDITDEKLDRVLDRLDAIEAKPAIEVDLKTEKVRINNADLDRRLENQDADK